MTINWGALGVVAAVSLVIGVLVGTPHRGRANGTLPALLGVVAVPETSLQGHRWGGEG